MNFESIAVPVTGGSLHVATHGLRAGSHAVVLIHGITANHQSWALVAKELGDDVAIVAPDLRGRAGSASLPGPYGMKAHAADIRAILDHIGADTATIVGHSMGGFVAAAFATEYPERVHGLVLLDGGVTIADVPEGTDIDEVLNAILGPTMQRLSMTFPTVDDWLAFWKQHPSLQEWSDAIETYVMEDMVGEEGAYRSSCNVDAIRADGADTLGPAGYYFRNIARPTPWIRAPRGLLNQVPPLYPDEVAAQIVADYPMLQDMLIDDVNHFTIAISEPGAKAVAEVIRTQI